MNTAIRERFAERLALAHRTPKTRQHVPLDMQDRMHAHEIADAQWPRVALAREIRAARNEKQVKPDAVQIIRNRAYEEDLRNEILYGREIARELRSAR